MRTLRVYGLAREPMSFIPMSLYHTGGFESSPQLRQHFALEPGVLLHPEPVARARVRQREKLGQVFVAGAHGLGQSLLSALAEVISLRIGAYEERQPDARQERAQPRVPVRCAFGPRRQVARFARSRVAQAGGNDGDAAFVVEIPAPDAQPLAQQIARGVVPGNAALVHAPAGRLPDDEDTRRGRSAQHRPGWVGKMGLADCARPDFG